jgi:murein DD-endopeptidase MepM/ murein hydrolase activator NlpD
MKVRPEARKTVAIVAVILVVSAALIGVVSAKHQAYELRVDEKLVGYVSDEALVAQAVNNILAQSKSGQIEMALMNKIATVKVEYSGKTLDKAQAEAALKPELKLGQKACVIQVNGKEAVVLVDKASAERAVAELKTDYVANISKAGNVNVQDLKFNEEVALTERAVDPSQIKSVADAKMILLRGTDKLVIYSVKSGDSLWTIARANNMMVDDLRKANPDLRGDRLDIGQKLNLAVAEPYINLVSVEKVVQTINIAFRTEVREDPDLWPWQQVVKQAGVYGKKEVTLEIRRQNGKEIGRTVLHEELLSEPKTQMMVQGSKISPDLGTGQYAWPTTGKITSRFGSRRSGYHQGLDIAAPVGTPVYAADAGTVVWAGVRAGYGNLIIVDHGGGKTITMYGHLSQMMAKVGDTVKRSQLIGKVGSTGRSTGPHLHFEIRVEGSAQNPIAYYPEIH